MKKDIRCVSCQALLFKIASTRGQTPARLPGIEIKCRRCGALNAFRADEPD
ncbi:Com family DNA-binding transcriptional regulator [Notoacmeibacter ruber]|uniref:Com family DNA-binding transcriptional regulator n=1 Tax=Notoacmeibacter ruber TaxID=2670375 RepID=A0A3L7JH31_9HYPH|nr:Com family DNA-binding transcriptional regulator [Notoacmeibacter ruber]